jgi:hypothetical protein
MIEISLNIHSAEALAQLAMPLDPNSFDCGKANIARSIMSDHYLLYLSIFHPRFPCFSNEKMRTYNANESGKQREATLLP